MDGGDVSKAKEFFFFSPFLTKINDFADGDLLWSVRLIETAKTKTKASSSACRRRLFSLSLLFLDKLQPK